MVLQQKVAYLSIAAMNPELLHVWSVHLPLLGGAFMVLLLAVYALSGRSRAVAACAFAVGLAGSAGAPVVMGSGEAAFERFSNGQNAALADDAGAEAALQRHEAYAHSSGKLFYLVLVASAAGLIIVWLRPRWVAAAAAINLVLAVIAVGANLYAAKTGGEIRRPDFRVPSVTA